MGRRMGDAMFFIDLVCMVCRDILAKQLSINAKAAAFQPLEKPSFFMPYANPDHDVDVSNVRPLGTCHPTCVPTAP